MSASARKQRSPNPVSAPAPEPRTTLPFPPVGPTLGGPLRVGTPVLDRAAEAGGSLLSGASSWLRRGLDWAEDTGESVVDSGRELLDEAVAVAHEATDGVEDAVERGAEWVGEMGEAVEEGAEGAWRRAQETAHSAEEAVEHFREEVRDTAARAVASAGEAVDTVVEMVTGPDPAAFVDELEPGDSRTFSTGATVGLGLTGREDAEATVSRSDSGTYTVRSGGRGGLGLGAGLGSSGSLGGSADAGITGGLYVEYEYATAEEARRGIELLEREAAAMSVHVMGTMDSVSTGLSEEERAFLAEHSHATELTGEGAAGIAAALSPELGAVSVGGLGGRTGVTGAASVRFVRAGDGGLTVVVAEELGGASEGSLELGPSTGSGEAGTGGGVGLPSAAGSASRSVRMEHSYTVPAGITAADLLADPTILARVALSSTDTLTVTDTAEMGAVGNGMGTSSARSYSATGGLFDGGTDWRMAAVLPDGIMERTMRDDVSVHDTERTFHRDGLDLSPSMRLGPITAAFRLRDQTTHMDAPTVDRTATMAERRAGATP